MEVLRVNQRSVPLPDARHEGLSVIMHNKSAPKQDCRLVDVIMFVTGSKDLLPVFEKHRGCVGSEKVLLTSVYQPHQPPVSSLGCQRSAYRPTELQRSVGCDHERLLERPMAHSALPFNHKQLVVARSNAEWDIPPERACFIAGAWCRSLSSLITASRRATTCSGDLRSRIVSAHSLLFE